MMNKAYEELMDWLDNLEDYETKVTDEELEEVLEAI